MPPGRPFPRGPRSSVLSISSLPAAVAPSARRREIEAENLSAAALPPLTAQALFAATVRQSIEGGSSALLPFDRRRRLLVAASKLGLRTFDANLIIALVQEQSRAEGADEPEALPRRAGVRVAPWPGEDLPEKKANPMAALAVALLLGLVMGLLGALWILAARR